MPTQVCPNCSLSHDVAVYVTGQRIRCERCGIHFEVRRSDASVVGQRAVNAPTPLPPPTGTESTQLRVVGAGAPAEKPLNPTLVRPAPKIELPGLELIEILGRGGMGEVWRAEQKSLGRTVAVKLLPANLASDAEFVARFQKEASALAALNHPNIIQIIDRGVSNDQYYFVMEFVPGRSLRELMGGAKMSAPDALRVIAQICEAIDYAHEHGIIHRDLKPENILIDDRGHVKVADFGLAGIHGPGESAQHLTQTAVAMGTLNYMAPEQRRDAKNVDGRADLYSLGVIFYEMLTGELPIGRFKLPSEKIEGLDQRVDEIVVKALDSDPTGRQDRASQISAQLEPLIAELGSAARLKPPSRPSFKALPRQVSEVTRPVIERSKRTLFTALAVIGALLVTYFVVHYATGLNVGIWHGKEGTYALSFTKGPAHGHTAKGELPGNTDGELQVGSRWTEDARAGAVKLKLDFDPAGKAEEILHAHAGEWVLEDGALQSTQEGNQASGPVVVPRAYVDNRFFTTDKVTIEALVQMDPLGPDYPALKDGAQRYAELALRLDDLQVSLYAAPDTGMSLVWHFFDAKHDEKRGTTDRDVRHRLADATPAPLGRQMVLRLELEKIDDDVDITGYVDGVRFAHKAVDGLPGHIGKVALGCRNLRCTFRDVVVTGKKVPDRKIANLLKDHGEE